MNSLPPLYEITHVDLHRERPDQRPAPAAAGQGRYVVFWWQEIALGHVYIQPGQTPADEEAYLTALVAALTPTLRHYAARSPVSRKPGLEWLAEQNVTRWRAWMTTVFAGWRPASGPARVPVSVIVCTRNRPAQLRRCLQQLRTLRCAPAEILVVDNAPADNQSQEVAREFAEVIYRREPRAGLDIARNTGVRAARSPVVTFIDDDVVVHPDLLYHVWQTFQEPTTAAMTGLVLALALQTEAQVIFEQHWSFNRGYVDKRYDAHYLQSAAGQAAPVWEIGAGANMSFRKSVFDEVGYFDERLDVGAAGCSGDSELWYRILRGGHAIQYCPRAIVYHEHRRDMAGLQRQIFSYMRGHAAAGLIQQAQQPEAGYAHRLYRHLPAHYLDLIRQNFPFFRGRGRTLWAELKGVASGVVFYYRTRP